MHWFFTRKSNSKSHTFMWSVGSHEKETPCWLGCAKIILNLNGNKIALFWYCIQYLITHFKFILKLFLSRYTIVNRTEEHLLTRVVVNLFRLGYYMDKMKSGKKKGKISLRKKTSDISDLEKLKRKYQVIQKMGK